MAMAIRLVKSSAMSMESSHVGNGNGDQEQERSGASSTDEEIVDVNPSSAGVDSPSTVQYDFVMKIDNAELNNMEQERSGAPSTDEEIVDVNPSYADGSTPPAFRVKNEDIGACARFGAWEQNIIIALLCVALQVLLQTNLPTAVTCCLLIAVVFAFSYLLLLAPLCLRKYNNCVTYAAYVCFGITTFAMAFATVLRARDLVG